MVSIRRWTALATLAGVALLLALAAERAPADESYTFPPQDDAVAKRVLLFAAVRVFGTESGGDQIGSGFVIDGDSGLIVSAKHVVSGLNGVAWVAFPHDDNRPKVLMPKSGSSQDKSAHDLSILQLDPPLDDLHAIEVQFDKIHDEEKHRVTGFGRSEAEPLPGEAQPEKTDDCSYALRTPNLHGDSGAALLTPQGLVDGIAVIGAESGVTGTPGANALMRVLPLSCVRDDVLDVVPDNQSDKIMNTFWNGKDAAFRGAFQPSPSASKWSAICVWRRRSLVG